MLSRLLQHRTLKPAEEQILDLSSISAASPPAWPSPCSSACGSQLRRNFLQQKLRQLRPPRQTLAVRKGSRQSSSPPHDVMPAARWRPNYATNTPTSRPITVASQDNDAGLYPLAIKNFTDQGPMVEPVFTDMFSPPDDQRQPSGTAGPQLDPALPARWPKPSFGDQGPMGQQLPHRQR